MKEGIAMVQLIVGDKGKGKTRYLLEQANKSIQEVSGNVVFLDKSSKKMYELNNRIRLIDVSVFPLRDSAEFIGFLCGIISQDHDLEIVYLDSFLKLAKLPETGEGLADVVAELEQISAQFQVDFYLSIARDKEELDGALQDKIVASL